MPRRSLEVVTLTNLGKVRTYNEDSVAADREQGIAILADGMGGHRAGEVASSMATQIILRELKTAALQPSGDRSAVRQTVERIINRADKAIHAAAASRSSREGMGTTLALAWFHAERVMLGHIGDSRIYRLRGERLQLLTRDDSLLEDQVEQGLIAAADAGASHNRSFVTRALGAGKSIAAHLRDEDVRADDILLLCSDGLNDLVDDADIELIIHSLRNNLRLAADILVQTANDNGGYDNVSVILVKVLRRATGPRAWVARLLGRNA